MRLCPRASHAGSESGGCQLPLTGSNGADLAPKNNPAGKQKIRHDFHRLKREIRHGASLFVVSDPKGSIDARLVSLNSQLTGQGVAEIEDACLVVADEAWAFDRHWIGSKCLFIEQTVGATCGGILHHHAQSHIWRS